MNPDAAARCVSMAVSALPPYRQTRRQKVEPLEDKPLEIISGNGDADVNNEPCLLQLRAPL